MIPFCVIDKRVLENSIVPKYLSFLSIFLSVVGFTGLCVHYFWGWLHYNDHKMIKKCLEVRQKVHNTFSLKISAKVGGDSIQIKETVNSGIKKNIFRSYIACIFYLFLCKVCFLLFILMYFFFSLMLLAFTHMHFNNKGIFPEVEITQFS